MARPTEADGKPLKRIHVLIFEEDEVRLKAYFGDTIGVTKAIRSLIHSSLDALDKKLDAKLAAQEQT